MPPPPPEAPAPSDVDSERVVSTVPSGFRTVFSVTVTRWPLTIFVVVVVLVIMPPPPPMLELELKDVNALPPTPPRPPNPELKKSSKPPMPPMPPAPASAFFSSGISATNASVVVMSEATLAASARAWRTTRVGSMMPAPIMSTYSPSCALYPWLSSVCFRRCSTTTTPSLPAFCTMDMMGTRRACFTMSFPTFWSKLAKSMSSSFLELYSSAQPPPGTMPSSTAAFVAFRASLSRSLTS
mmetsp:Transcript_91935/g.256116  ORF Transcript_91935/g.256116 Transcript_91935/m.256116 type:complete len:240 (-) Transcript_91935:601-1320(-)